MYETHLPGMMVTEFKREVSQMYETHLFGMMVTEFQREVSKHMKLTCLGWWWQRVWKRSQPYVWDSLVWDDGDREFEREVSHMYETHLFGMMVTESLKEKSAKCMRLTCLGWWWQSLKEKSAKCIRLTCLGWWVAQFRCGIWNAGDAQVQAGTVTHTLP